MIKLLYWLVYNVDLGPAGPLVMKLAVKSWLARARVARLSEQYSREIESWSDSCEGHYREVPVRATHRR
jgi:hypothetical protein